jgi:pimeloyl-ACP methyl ester carboxylesterase
LKRIWYIIPGILTDMNDARCWNYQAEVWFKRRNPDDVCTGFHYSDGIIGGTLALDSQAAAIADDLVDAQKAGLSPVVIGHSNGCRLALKALTLAPELERVHLHLIAGAVDRDCSANGLNRAADNGQIDRVTVYVSPKDKVLAIPALSYGKLGLDGPSNVGMALAAMLTKITQTCGHCDWVARDFARTMEMIATAEEMDLTTESTESTEATAGGSVASVGSVVQTEEPE